MEDPINWLYFTFYIFLLTVDIAVVIWIVILAIAQFKDAYTDLFKIFQFVFKACFPSMRSEYFYKISNPYKFIETQTNLKLVSIMY